MSEDTSVRSGLRWLLYHLPVFHHSSQLSDVKTKKQSSKLTKKKTKPFATALWKKNPNKPKPKNPKKPPRNQTKTTQKSKTLEENPKIKSTHSQLSRQWICLLTLMYYFTSHIVWKFIVYIFIYLCKSLKTPLRF